MTLVNVEPPTPSWFRQRDKILFFSLCHRGLKCPSIGLPNEKPRHPSAEKPGVGGRIIKSKGAEERAV